MIAGLIIQEVTALVDAAISANVMTYADSGLMHEEIWRHREPEEYCEVYPINQISEDAALLNNLKFILLISVLHNNLSGGGLMMKWIALLVLLLVA